MTALDMRLIIMIASDACTKLLSMRRLPRLTVRHDALPAEDNRMKIARGLVTAIIAIVSLQFPAAAMSTCPLPELMKYDRECDSAIHGRPETLIAVCTNLSDDADTCIPVPGDSSSGEALRMRFYYLRGYGRMGQAVGHLRLGQESARKVLFAQARADFTVVAQSPNVEPELRRNAKAFLNAKLLAP
jgi:hypothetical protein